MVSAVYIVAFVEMVLGLSLTTASAFLIIVEDQEQSVKFFWIWSLVFGAIYMGLSNLLMYSLHTSDIGGLVMWLILKMVLVICINVAFLLTGCMKDIVIAVCVVFASCIMVVYWLVIYNYEVEGEAIGDTVDASYI